MRYSVIIPVYNRPDEVDELLQSLTVQHFKGFEVVVVEDGSFEIESIFFLYISNKIITYSGYPLYPMRSTVLHLLGSLLLSL